MAAIAMLHHMPTSQAVEHATALVRGSMDLKEPVALNRLHFDDSASHKSYPPVSCILSPT